MWNVYENVKRVERKSSYSSPAYRFINGIYGSCELLVDYNVIEWENDWQT